MRSIIFFLVAIIFASSVCLAQSGNTLEVKQTIVGGGGGSSSGGNFEVTLNVGQNIAGKAVEGRPFAITSGFFGFTPLGTTAALVSLSGQVISDSGAGVRNVRVTLSSPIHGSQTFLTTTFGRFHFDGVPIGETYLISVSSRRFWFDEPSRVVSVLDEVSGLVFIAHEK
jgi:hypothetical protein